MASETETVSGMKKHLASFDISAWALAELAEIAALAALMSAAKREGTGPPITSVSHISMDSGHSSIRTVGIMSL